MDKSSGRVDRTEALAEWSRFRSTRRNGTRQIDRYVTPGVRRKSLYAIGKGWRITTGLSHECNPTQQ